MQITVSVFLIICFLYTCLLLIMLITRCDLIAAKDLIGNWNTRPKWDKTFGVVHVLDDAEHFKVLYMWVTI